MSSLEYFQGQNLIGLHITVTQIMCLYRAILQNQQTLVSCNLVINKNIYIFFL